jgi:glycosyltransferase involved in cell wall biosynthesis
LKNLMITIGFPPDNVGGTETYVLGLIEALKKRDQIGEVLFLESCSSEHCSDIECTNYSYEGIRVHVIRVNKERHQLERILFDSDLLKRILDVFLETITAIHPDIIHFHPLQLGIESYLIEELRKRSYPVLFTYHSSTTTCMRGDLVLMGNEVCDGRVIPSRCIACVYHSRGIPSWMAELLGKIPLSVYETGYQFFQKIVSLKKLRSFCSLPLMLHKRRDAWVRSTTFASKMIAVCEWVKAVALKNGASAEKIVFSRHGLRFIESQLARKPHDGIVRFGFLGRLTPEKGVLVLVEALKKISADINFEFEFSSSTFSRREPTPPEQKCIQAVQELSKADSRIKIKGSESDKTLLSLLSTWDALVVPSLWLESGPMVIYESFSVQTPVIGSKRGGIQELVEDGNTGFLFEANNARELTDLMIQIALSPEKIRALRKNIKPPRTFDHVAEDMLAVYLMLSQEQREIKKV